MMYLAAALTIIAALAWDFGRRWLARDSGTVMVLKAEIETARTALKAEIDKSGKVTEGLARDWLVRFKQLEDRQTGVEASLKQLNPTRTSAGQPYNPRA